MIWLKFLKFFYKIFKFHAYLHIPSQKIILLMLTAVQRKFISVETYGKHTKLQA